MSIERENFKAIEVSDLNNLSAEKVFERLSNSLKTKINLSLEFFYIPLKFFPR